MNRKRKQLEAWCCLRFRFLAHPCAGRSPARNRLTSCSPRLLFSFSLSRHLLLPKTSVRRRERLSPRRLSMHRVPIESSLDLHTFAPRDIPSVVEEYVNAAYEAGLRE